MHLEKYFWKCPKCHEKIYVLKQLADYLFDEDGEAEFSVEKGCGIWFHVIDCPKCNARWTMNVSGMEEWEIE